MLLSDRTEKEGTVFNFLKIEHFQLRSKTYSDRHWKRLDGRYMGQTKENIRANSHGQKRCVLSHGDHFSMRG